MGGALQFLFDGPADAPLTVALAHGAGAPMDSPFMTFFAKGLAHHGWRVARFEFPYMAVRRAEEKRRPPDRLPVLTRTWRAAIAAFERERAGGRLVIGGKSLGGRIASMVADAAGVRGLVCLGYPFCPPRKAEAGVRQAAEAVTARIAHLKTLSTPALIVQGTRDPFGGPEQVGTYDLASSIALHWIEDGDHGFVPRRASGRTTQQNQDEALDAVVTFLARQSHAG